MPLREQTIWNPCSWLTCIYRLYHYSTTYIATLYKIQWCVSNTITVIHCSYTISVSELIRNLNWPCLMECRHQNHMCLLYNIIHKSCCNPYVTKFLPNTRTLHWFIYAIIPYSYHTYTPIPWIYLFSSYSYSLQLSDTTIHLNTAYVTLYTSL